MSKLSPMMQQYMQIKQEYNDCILFFRLGDFYEMFFEDAKLASKELELTLTGRDCGLEERAPMCGVPYHSVEGYIAKLIKKGYKVAICEQMTEPQKGKALVERDIIRVISPGTVIEESMLDEKKNNYILSLYKESANIGFAYCDVSTGEFTIYSLSGSDIYFKFMDEIIRIEPVEVLANHEMLMWLECHKGIFKAIELFPELYGIEYSKAHQLLADHFHNDIIDDMDMSSAICAAGALFEYLLNTQKNSLMHINGLRVYAADEYMKIDAFTRHNLEISSSIRDGSTKGTLLWHMDRTTTAMGSRLLRKWIELPLQSVEQINMRLCAVEEFNRDIIARQQIIEKLKFVKDIERILTKISYNTINPRDLVLLRTSIEVIPEIKETLSMFQSNLLSACAGMMDDFYGLTRLISDSITDNPPLNLKEGGYIKPGYSQELDEVLSLSKNVRSHILKMEASEREETGIKNLKIGYNRIFGYYIEVSKSNMDKVPFRYIRKQTIANGERYITEELNALEEQILSANDRAAKLEYELFISIVDNIKLEVEKLQSAAAALAQIDVLLSFSNISLENNYCRPKLNTAGEIKIRDGRHPVVERSIEARNFVPNNVEMNMGDDRFIIITGPNMSGKSTFIRQVAIITLMAHIGSFVPASYADISVTDRIFSRVGASDDLFMGQSTFMVEMTEVANILRNATNKSLVILDEIGRGTSTFDGLSIAWSVVEFIADTQKIGAKTLFATHYHQLSELEGKVQGIRNYCVSVKEYGEDIIFLRKIVRGGTDKSFGIHVAKLAGLPDEVIVRARQVLLQLEKTDVNDSKINSLSKPGYEQLSFHSINEDILSEIKSLDIESMSPIEALNKLFELKKRVDHGK